MEFIPLSIPDVVLIKPKIFGDHRGFFLETWRDDLFKEKVADFSFVQDNHSKSERGVLRGLHYQIEQPQGKLVRVISGEIFDVAVDVRQSSTTFGQWIGVKLTSEEKKMLWIPPGFAHGFYVLSREAEFTYKCTDYYAPEHERCIIWNDSDIGINWPVSQSEAPILSEKDAAGAYLKNAELYQ